MAHATIIDLPTETLNSIFRHFCLHCCHGDTEGSDSYFRSSKHHQQQAHESSWYLADFRQPLVSLSLVSKRLRDVAQQVLHHEFVLGYGDSWRSASHSWDRRLTSFLRTVGQRPDLGAAVRRVSLHPKLLHAAELGDAAVAVDLRQMGRNLGLELPDESMPPRYQGRRGKLKKPLINEGWRPTPGSSVACEMYAQGYGRKPRMEPDDYTCHDNFRERHALGFEIIAILIGTLPSVERLSIRKSIVDYDTSYPSVLRSVAVNKRRRLLKTLDIVAQDYMHETMPRVPFEAAGIVELAEDTLQTLNLHTCRGFWTDPEQAPTFKALKTLRLTGSRLSSEELGVLLSCCTGGLSSFTYKAAPSIHSSNRSDNDARAAIEALRTHARTLRILDLDTRHVERSPVVQPLLPGSLTEFTALEDLLLSINTLLVEGSRGLTEEIPTSPQLSELLPASIRSLKIGAGQRYQIPPQLSDRLLGLARAVAEEGKLPRLRQVRCDSRFKRGLDSGQGPEINGIFQGAGVDFGIWLLAAERDCYHPGR